MKKIIAKLLKKFITRYRLYLWVGSGNKVILKVDDLNYIKTKKGDYHHITIQYWTKTKKRIVYVDDLQVNI